MVRYGHVLCVKDACCTDGFHCIMSLLLILSARMLGVIVFWTRAFYGRQGVDTLSCCYVGFVRWQQQAM